MNSPAKIPRKFTPIFYGVIMPAATISTLLGISSIIARKLWFGSLGDWCIRILICFWFCALYIRLSRFSKYHPYPNIRWLRSDAGPVEKFFLIGLGIFFGIGCAIITWWIVILFLPIFTSFAIALAVLNGVIIAYPVVTQYWVYKM